MSQEVTDPLGADILWTDYQQGEHNYDVSKDIPNLNPTIMLNRIRGGKKGSLILSRFGGVGSHKYTVGFTGDQMHTWVGL